MSKLFFGALIFGAAISAADLACAQQQLDSVQILAGGGQSVQMRGGSAVFQPVQVKVTHSDGNPAAGTQVLFNCAEALHRFNNCIFGNGSMYYWTQADSNGVATSTNFTVIGNAAGTFNLGVSGQTAPPAFTSETVTAP